MTTKTADVLVIGGGLAGLTAAVAASQSGAKVVVLERAEPGGRARSHEREGFVFNQGGHALYLGGPGEAVRRRIGLDVKGSRPPLKRFMLADVDGTLHQMPVGAGSLMATTAVGARSKATLANLLARLQFMDAGALASTTVDEWLADRGLREDAERVLRAIVRISTYGADTSVMSAGAALAQVQMSSANGVLYLDGGWSQMVEALRTRVEVRHVRATAVHGDSNGVEVDTADGVLTAGAAVVATGNPTTTSMLLDGAAWADLGGPLTAACLDVGARRVPAPGYVLGLDEPIFGTTVSPPAASARPDTATLAVIRYGATAARADRAALTRWLGHMGVDDHDVLTSRFLADMTVSSTIPMAGTGGLAGRPSITDSGTDRVFIAGDWVGHEGYMVEASFASGEAAGRAAARLVERAAMMVR